MYSFEDQWDGGVFGFPTHSEPLQFQSIIAREQDFEELAFTVLEWFSHCYGLVLPKKIGSDGKYFRPIPMR